MSHKFETVEQFREYILKYHTSVKAALARGEATMCRSPFGLLWFGPEDGLISSVRLAFIHEDCGPVGRKKWTKEDMPFPQQIQPKGHDFVLELQGVEDGRATYKRAS